MIRSVFLAVLAMMTANQALAQAPAGQPSPGNVFVGGSIGIISAAGAQQDPAGHGYLVSYFHGSVDWPTFGAQATAGAFFTRSVTIAAEFVLSAAVNAAVTEQSRGHTDFQDVSSHYAFDERKFDVIAGYAFRSKSGTEVRPLGGFAVAWGTQTLTDRQSHYSYGYGTYDTQLRDISADIRRYGVVFGGDVLVPIRHATAFVASGRMYWLRTELPPYSYDRTPPLDPYALLVTVGVQWRFGG